MFGPLGWSSGPAKLDSWPLQLKSRTAADFTCKLCLTNKTQMQCHLTLGYFLVQYHFAIHPPFKTIWTGISESSNGLLLLGRAGGIILIELILFVTLDTLALSVLQTEIVK
jgi:hypothetical protein